MESRLVDAAREMRAALDGFEAVASSWEPSDDDSQLLAVVAQLADVQQRFCQVIATVLRERGRDIALPPIPE